MKQFWKILTVSLIICSLTLLITGLAGCDDADGDSGGTTGVSATPDINAKPECPDFTINIAGADNTSLTKSDVLSGKPGYDLEIITETMTVGGADNIYVGISLKDALAKIGITQYATITVTGYWEGYDESDRVSSDTVAVLDKALVDKADTLLAWAENGQLIEGGKRLMIAPKTGTEEQFLKNILTITINQ